MQIQHALAYQIEQAARSCHQNIYAFTQLRDLRVHAHAAKNHRRFELQEFAVSFDAFVNLRGQLARGRENERTHAGVAKLIGHAAAKGELVQKRQSERSSFASASLSASE